MAVAHICNHNVATIGADADVAKAAAHMREAHVGDLIVVERRGAAMVPVGVITDRDIVVAVVAKGVAAADVTVGDAMSRDPLTVHEHNGIELALREMRRVGVRRAPVVDAEGALIGVLSIDDVVDHLATQLSHIADIIRLEQSKEENLRR